MYRFFIFLALYQTTITIPIAPAINIVTQPPWKNLNKLAVRNESSIVKKITKNNMMKNVFMALRLR